MLSIKGAEPGYEPVYWGDCAARFRWDLASRPRTKLLGMGGDEDFAGLGSLREAGEHSPLDRPAAPAAMDGPVLGAPVELRINGTLSPRRRPMIRRGRKG
jgi:hypothetical protein